MRERLERKKGKVSAEHLESAALRELIDEQRNAMKLDTRGEETYNYVIVVLDALREGFNKDASNLKNSQDDLFKI